MPLVLLIRHGENDYVKKGRLAGRLPGVHLNDRGNAQAKALAVKLKNSPVSAVYSSPLERTMETAKPIAKALNLKVIPRPGLLEVDYGTWQDRKLKKLSKKAAWRLVQVAPSRFGFPKGESFFEAQIRVVGDLEKLVKIHKPKDVIACVSHSDLIKLAVAHFIGLPLDMFQRLHIAPASVTILHIGIGSAHLINMNYESSFTFSKG